MRLIFIVLCFIFIHYSGSTQNKLSEIEYIRKKIQCKYLSSPIDKNSIERIIKEFRSDSTWEKINYVDVSREGFQHIKHLENIIILSRAYRKDPYYKGNIEIKNIIDQAIAFWLIHDFQCENWWFNQIGVPTEFIKILYILDEDINKKQYENVLHIAERANLHAWGARPGGDRMKIAGLSSQTAIFKRDSCLLDTTVRVMEEEIKFSNGRGLQQDYSFHHRTDKVNNTLTYGLGYGDVFTEWIDLLSETSYQFTEKPVNMIIDYYLDGVCKQLIYGIFPDPGVMNRENARPWSGRAFTPTILEYLLHASDYRKEEIKNLIKARKNEPHKNSSFAYHYWCSDHFVFQRPNFYTSVRMYSSRNHSMEVPYNGEGLLNHYKGDGANYISKNASEYSKISPVYDWKKIPGTTVVQKEERISENKVQQKGITNFVGAVTDGLYGAVGFDFISPLDKLTAKKSWFFFDDYYICLGADINYSDNYQVITTINQCYLKDDVIISGKEGKSTIKSGHNIEKNMDWVYHDNTGYFFPRKQKIFLNTEEKSGSWKLVNRQTSISNEEIKKNIFTLAIDHHLSPSQENYSYIVVPSTEIKTFEKFIKKNSFYILSNHKECQSVYDKNLKIGYAVFYSSGNIQPTNMPYLEVDSPCIVMIKYKNNKLESITISDPTQKLEKINIKIEQKSSAETENYSAIWDDIAKVTNISIKLPLKPYAGKSITVKL